MAVNDRQRLDAGERQWPEVTMDAWPEKHTECPMATNIIRAAGSTERDFKKTWKIVKKYFSKPQESMVQKLSLDGSGPPQMMCPKSGKNHCQKIVPAKTLDHEHNIKTQLSYIFLTNRTKKGRGRWPPPLFVKKYGILTMF